MNQKYIIWNSQPDFEDWVDGLREEYPDADDNRLYEIMMETNNSYFDDARMNLSHIEYDQEIICIGTLGLWNGQRKGYKKMYTYKPSQCLRSLLNCISDIEFYVDHLGDFRADEYHHDGTNHYLYRVWKDISEEQKDNFLAKVINGTVTRRDITRYTSRIGKDIADVYGWKVRA